MSLARLKWLEYSPPHVLLQGSDPAFLRHGIFWSMFSQTRLHQVSHNHSSLCAQESGWSKLKLKRSQHFRGPLACRGCYCNLRVGRVFGPVEDPGMPETAGGASQRPQPLPASQSSPQRLSPSGFVRGCMARQGSEGGGEVCPKNTCWTCVMLCHQLMLQNPPEGCQV